MYRRAPSTSPIRGSAQSRIAVKDCGLIIKHASGSRALPPPWGRWRGLFLCSYHTKNTIRASADSLIVSADAIRKPADTIRIFSALQNLLIFSEEREISAQLKSEKRRGYNLQ